MEPFSNLTKNSANIYINNGDMKHDMTDAGITSKIIQSYNKYSLTTNAIDNVAKVIGKDIPDKSIKTMLHHLLNGGAIDQVSDIFNNIINHPKKKRII